MGNLGVEQVPMYAAVDEVVAERASYWSGSRSSVAKEEEVEWGALRRYYVVPMCSVEGQTEEQHQAEPAWRVEKTERQLAHSYGRVEQCTEEH